MPGGQVPSLPWSSRVPLSRRIHRAGPNLRAKTAIRGVVLLPHARARLLLDDTARMAVFARRFAPARCVLLEAGTRIEIDGVGWPPGVRAIGEDGHVTSLEAA